MPLPPGLLLSREPSLHVTEESALEPPVLTASVIRRLFDAVSSHLRDARSFNHRLTIAGGAALALRWGQSDRMTSDIDVLEHRFRYHAQPPGTRSTGTVDFISMRFPAQLERAAALVADAAQIPSNWLNGAVAIFAPAGDLQLEVLYRSDCLTVESPGPRILLAMKLHAGRDRDIRDAALLIHETGVTQPQRLLDLVEEAYGPDVVTADTVGFVDTVLKFDLETDP